ncbi:MAG: chemotaxis protein CheB [Cycloclasticus sp.]|nr:chemotaxis protein CheB [Cycloclasticus sp.]MBQ0789139.1 chemotaxis protein CheB [Cycloclasticus sp.]
MNRVNNHPDLIMIGASTGGPQALQRILSDLPEDYPCPIVITQHMPDNFISNFVKQLDNVCALQVKKADKGELVTAGVVYVSSGDKCLQICLNNKQMMTSYASPINTTDICPSVNALFISGAALSGVNILAIILTGIGDDGTIGAIELKKQGAHIWVQEEEGCAVFGMPKSALLAGVVDEKLSLDEMCLNLREL